MRGKTAKLLRKVAATNVYDVKDFTHDVNYIRSNTRKNIMLAPESLRTTYKYLKKSYKKGGFTTRDLIVELESNK